MTTERSALLAIRGGTVSGLVVVANDPIVHETLSAWAVDERISEIIRVPEAVAQSLWGRTAEEARHATGTRTLD